MTACCIDMPRPIPLHRPWWRRWLDRVTEDRPRHRPMSDTTTLSRGRGRGRDQPDLRDLRGLRHLSARTLRDIGAPEWVATEREAADRLHFDLMRL